MSTLYTGTPLRYHGPGSRPTRRSEPGPCCQPPLQVVTVRHYLTSLSRPQICLLSRQQQSMRPFLPTEENVNMTLCANRYPDARVWGSQTVSACSCLQTKRPELIYSLRVPFSPSPPVLLLPPPGTLFEFLGTQLSKSLKLTSFMTCQRHKHKHSFTTEEFWQHASWGKAKRFIIRKQKQVTFCRKQISSEKNMKNAMLTASFYRFLIWLI